MLMRSDSDVRIVFCDECPKRWRYGCAECALEFADYHRKAFHHSVTVSGERAALPTPKHVRNLLGGRW